MRRAIVILACLGLLAGCAGGPGSQAEQQALVDRATLAVQDMLGDNTAPARDAAARLRSARAVVICPQVFRVGFIFGGEGGACVLVGRDGAGSWSSPAFYGLASGSLGLQIGVQDMQVMMLVMTGRGLAALMDSQVKIGADVAIAVATLGAGLEGATTAAGGADIVALARSRGLFAGIALDGAVIAIDNRANRRVYGRDVTARMILENRARPQVDAVVAFRDRLEEAAAQAAR